MDSIFTHQFDNGFTLIAESMPHVRSAAFQFMIPAGSAYDPPDQLGMSAVLVDLLTRGAGKRDSRTLSEDLDRLGLDRSESAGTVNFFLSGALLGRNLAAALEIYATILHEPHLPDDELEAVKEGALLTIQGLEDEPSSKTMSEFRRRYFPDPLGRDRRGTVEGVGALTSQALRNQFERLFHPHGMILAVAGNIEWEKLRDQVGRLFGGGVKRDRQPFAIADHTPTSDQLQKDLDQTQIVFGYPSVPLSHPSYYAAMGTSAVLGLDMSARLFTEVREKHGLCYEVSCWHDRFVDRGALLTYTAARNEKAQETLDRTLHEHHRLSEGIEEEEVERVRTGLKASLIMRQESANSRANSLLADWYALGKIRSLKELKAGIDSITPTSILQYVAAFPAKNPVFLTYGPTPLKLPN